MLDAILLLFLTMFNLKRYIMYLRIFVILAIITFYGCEKKPPITSEGEIEQPNERHRPIFHHTPKEGWMNDPNGMVYANGVYHLFYQHNPDTTIWGPMHWGHATSRNLVHWEQQEIALYPDTLGTIFSGSAVVDENNTAGFGKDALVAVFTHHNPQLEQENTGLHQYQSIAYSIDNGKTWEKYKGNPVLPNPGIRDFRDPKVIWHEESAKWIMTLATQQTVTFYSSPDLKVWQKLSEFGEGIGTHDGVWECPDLIRFEVDGNTLWALLVSINPGGPNGGSATQYFLGDFDGKNFTPLDTLTRWIDYGRDNYAGVTFSNTGDRKIFMGWMNNWQYANEVPTENWRGANTFPRELGVKEVKGRWFLTSQPVEEVSALIGAPQNYSQITVNDSIDLHKEWGAIPKAYRLDFKVPAAKPFLVRLSNALHEAVIVGFDPENNQFFTDRRSSNTRTFKENFPSRQVAPRLSQEAEITFSMLVDVASMEVFVDGGLTVMTDIFFPNEDFQSLTIFTEGEVTFNELVFSPIN